MISWSWHRGHLLLRSPNDIGVFVQHAFGLCVNVPYGRRVPVSWSVALWISTMSCVCDSVVPKCASELPWSQNVPPNGSKAPLVENHLSEKSEGVYFVILNIYNGFKWSKRNVSKICTVLLHRIRAVEFVSSSAVCDMILVRSCVWWSYDLCDYLGTCYILIWT